jgi:hypothetical protein
LKLPYGDLAIIELEKLQGYCLNANHPRGRHKARVFFSALGLTAANAEELRVALVVAARNADAVPGISDRFGVRYIVDFEFMRSERRATIRSNWIVRHGESVPRFVTCFVL